MKPHGTYGEGYEAGMRATLGRVLDAIESDAASSLALDDQADLDTLTRLILEAAGCGDPRDEP